MCPGCRPQNLIKLHLFIISMWAQIIENYWPKMQKDSTESYICGPFNWLWRRPRVNNVVNLWATHDITLMQQIIMYVAVCISNITHAMARHFATFDWSLCCFILLYTKYRLRWGQCQNLVTAKRWEHHVDAVASSEMLSAIDQLLQCLNVFNNCNY